MMTVNGWYWSLRSLGSEITVTQGLPFLVKVVMAFNGCLRGFEVFKKELEELMHLPGPLKNETIRQYSDLKERYNHWIHEYEQYLFQLESATGDRLAIGFERFHEPSILNPEHSSSQLLDHGYFSAGTPYDAFATINTVFARARTEILLVDGYVDESVLKTLGGQNVGIRLITQPPSPGTNRRFDLFKVAAERYKQQHGGLEVRTTAFFHDRFIMTDSTDVYHLGASVKDAGNKAFKISQIQQPGELADIKADIEREWRDGSQVV